MVPKKDLKKKVLKPSDFLNSAEESDIFKYQKDSDEEEISLIDDVRVRRDEDWNILSHQIVGSESY